MFFRGTKKLEAQNLAVCLFCWITWGCRSLISLPPIYPLVLGIHESLTRILWELRKFCLSERKLYQYTALISVLQQKIGHRGWFFRSRNSCKGCYSFETFPFMCNKTKSKKVLSVYSDHKRLHRKGSLNLKSVTMVEGFKYYPKLRHAICGRPILFTKMFQKIIWHVLKIADA